MLGREQPILAPLVADILNDPSDLVARALQPVYVYRDRTSLPAGSSARREGPMDWLLATTEADALQDLDENLHANIQILEEHGGLQAEHHIVAAQALQSRLRFIGAKGRAMGERAIAGRLLERLQTSPDGELHVSAPAFESESLIFNGVCRWLALMNPDALDAIHPFDPDDKVDARTWDRRRRNGVVIADDWTMTAKQVKRQIAGIIRDGNLSADDIEGDYVCASDAHIQEGISGVRILSHYTYPAMAESGSVGRASVAGGHGTPDHGFRVEIAGIANYVERIGREATGVSPGWQHPLLYTVAAVHKWRDFETVTRRGDPEQFVAFDAAVADYNRCAAHLAGKVRGLQFA